MRFVKIFLSMSLILLLLISSGCRGGSRTNEAGRKIYNEAKHTAFEKIWDTIFSDDDKNIRRGNKRM